MSTINDIVHSAQGGQIIENLSHRFGLASWQTEAAVVALIPALSAGLQKAAERPDSLGPVIGAASDPQHQAAFESAELAHSQASVEGGGAIVDHLFGSASAAGQIAQLASRESNVRADILQQLLPVLASIVAGGLSRTLEQQGQGSLLGRLAAPSAAEPEPSPAPQAAPAPPAGGLVALLSGVVAALFGGKPTPASAPASQPAAPNAEVSGTDALQEALDQIRKTFAAGAPASADHQASLDELFGQVFGSARR